MNFKSNAAYKAWLAYGHASGEFAKTPGHQPVSVRGKSKNVQHAEGGFLIDEPSNPPAVNPNAPLDAYSMTYGELPPELERYMSIPGVNPTKVMEWFNLGLAEPQTYNQAKLLAEAVGYNPEQAKVVAAQWQMESAGGSRLSSAYNYFGIKSHNEAVRNKLAERGIDVSAGKEAATKEGAGKASKASFMEFNNAFEGFAAHKAFLETNQRYAKALNSDTAKDFAVGLERAGYATAPNYGTTLYQDYVAPKEKNPKSGDTRPKSLGETKSEKIKPFTQSFESTPELTKLPVLAPQRLEVEPQIDLNPTTGTGMYGSTSYQPEITPTKAVPLSANAGFFGSGKSSFNMGGLMNSYKNGGFNNPGFNALPVEVQDRIKARSYAAGGPMAGPLTEFNAGGSHEESSLGGIPQGMAPDGRMNLVEQGETKLDSANYIFSDRLKLTKEIAKGANLPAKFVGKTFADVSKSLNLPKSRRENDSIENNYKEKMLDELVQAQELHKQEEMAKDFAMMAEKYPEQMAAMMQQSVAPPMPMPGEAVAAGMNPAQEMPSPEPVPSSQLPMSYGGSMYACGGKMYDAGGTMRAIGAGAYGVGEGMLDTLTFGLTDSITDKGFDKLSEMGGGRTQEEMNREKMLRGFGNTAGAITGAVVSGGAATGSAISEGSEGAAQGLTNIKGTNAKFDATVNSLGQMGSMVGGLVGGNPTEAATSGAPQFAQTLMGAANNPMVQQGASMVSSFMANGGHLYPQINPMWKNNAGPMGQPLTNMYAAGGELFMDPAAMGGPGGPGTPTTPATPASPTLPDIMYYTPTFDGMSASDYGKKYKKDLQEYFNNPKDKSGIPMHGIASGWTPVDPANITNKIAAIEKMPAADLNDSILQEYLTLKNTPKEYFVDKAGSEAFLTRPYDLRSWSPTTRPAPAPPTPEQFYYTDYATGQPVYDYNAATGTSEPRLAPPGSLGNIQYSQYLEQAANSPEALAKISAQNAEREANMQRIANEGPAVPETAVEKMAREQEEFKAKNEAYRAQQMAKYRQNAMGGYTHAMGGHMYDGESTSTGFMFTPSGSSYTPNPNLLPNPWAHSGNMDLPTTDFSGAGRAPGTEGSGNYNVNTDLTNTTQDLSVKGTALQTLSGLAPIAYNTYQALKKAPTYKPEDFYTLQEAIRPDYSQAYNEAKNTYAALMKGAGQTGLSGGARAATLANAATIRNTAMGQVASAEENAYREDMARVRAANAAAKTEGNKLALQTNWAIQAAKQEHAKEALNQFKSMQESQVANDLAMKYAVMGAPDISRFINVGYTPYGQTLKEKLSPNKKKE